MRILHPTDFSKTAEKARALALDLAGRLDGELHVVHVQQRFDERVTPYAQLDTVNPAITEQLTKLKQEEIRHLQDRLAALTATGGSGNLLWGGPVRQLLAVAPEYDLIVMGAHGANRLDSAFVGGVAGRLVRRSPVPVVTVRDEATTSRVERILVATDFGDASKHAWAFCQRFAEAGIKLVLAHVIDIARLMGDRGYLNVVTEAMENLSRGGAERHVIHEGNPVTDIPTIAGEVGADLIAVGVRRHATVTGLLLGSHTDALIRSSEVPILSVPLTAN